MSSDQPKIEEVSEDMPPPLEEFKGTGMPDLGGAAAGGFGGGFDDGERGQSKSEKKTRKAVEKLGLKKVPGIVRVSIRKQKNVFVISNPDVFKAGKDGFVVFGEAKMEDAQGAALQNAFQNLQAQAAAAGANGAAADDDAPPPLQEVGDSAPAKAAAPAAAAPAAAAGAADEAGVEAKDIELVMAQVNCTRSQAVAALRKNGNDIVNAIMSLN